MTDNIDAAHLRPCIAEVLAEMRGRAEQETADAIYAAISNALPIYEDVYDQCCELIEPHVIRPGNNNGTLPASVVGSLSLLLKRHAIGTDAGNIMCENCVET